MNAWKEMPKIPGRKLARERVAYLATIMVAVSAILFATYVTWGQIFSGPRSARVPEDTEISGWEELLKAGHRIGPETASIEIVVFMDYECSPC